MVDRGIEVGDEATNEAEDSCGSAEAAVGSAGVAGDIEATDEIWDGMAGIGFTEGICEAEDRTEGRVIAAGRAEGNELAGGSAAFELGSDVVGNIPVERDTEGARALVEG